MAPKEPNKSCDNDSMRKCLERYQLGIQWWSPLLWPRLLMKATWNPWTPPRGWQSWGGLPWAGMMYVLVLAGEGLAVVKYRPEGFQE